MSQLSTPQRERNLLCLSPLLIRLNLEYSNYHHLGDCRPKYYPELELLGLYQLVLLYPFLFGLLMLVATDQKVECSAVAAFAGLVEAVGDYYQAAVIDWVVGIVQLVVVV